MSDLLRADGVRLWEDGGTLWLGVEDAQGLHSTSLTTEAKANLIAHLTRSIPLDERRSELDRAWNRIFFPSRAK